jgi:hypothetical protein
MSDPAPGNFELSILLPLGVIANQLMRVEADLRFLTARTSASVGGARPSGDMAVQAAARLEKINETLEVIRALASDVERDLQPRSANARPLQARSDRED